VTPAASGRRSAASVRDAILADLRHAVRALWRSPVYTVTAVLTLAIGIGATTAAYSIVGNVLLKPLPFAEPDRLVGVFQTVPSYDHIPPSYPDFEDFRTQNDVLEGVAFIDGEGITMRRADGGIGALAAMVTRDFFSVLRARPVLGRTLVAADQDPGAPPVAVLSYAFWTRAFGADRAVIGRTIDLTIGSFTVVGVLAPGEAYPEWQPGATTDLILPLGAVPSKQADLHQRGNHADTRTVARLKPGVTLEQARLHLGLIATRLATAYPATDSGFGANVIPLQREIVGDVRPAFAVLTGAVLLVFLLACADVANLGLVRASARARELGVRAALGAGHGRIVRYLLTESALVAAGGTLVGIVLAVIAVRVFIAASPGDVPRMDEIGLDGPALATTLGAAVVATLLCALAPLATIRRTDLIPVLKGGGRGASGDRRGLRLRTAIVTGQLAMTMILVVGAGLLVKSFEKLRHVNPGFDQTHLVDWFLEAPKDDDAPARWAFFQRAMAAATVPGVVSIALVNHPPLGGGGVDSEVGVDGKDPAKDSIGVGYVTITPHYFETMRIPLLRGRDFSDADMTPDAPVAIVSRAMVARYWPANTDPIGRRMTVLNGAPHDKDYRKPMTVTVVGVVADVKRYSLTEDKPSPFVYMPFPRPVWHGTNIVARTAGPPGALIAAIRHAAVVVDPYVTADQIQTAEQGIADGTARQRFTTSLLTAFSMVALLLATLGVYGVISYAVTQRVAEIGIRMALGAQPGDVIHLLVRQATVFVVIGLAIGIGGAALLARGMRGLLFGVTPLDPLTFVGVTVLLGGIALLATYIPARRAARVDPISALRAE